LDEAAGESSMLPMHFQSTGGASRNALTAFSAALGAAGRLA